MHVERFAPSPTGRLHLGHAFSAMLGHDAARAAGGRWLVRMEDLDQGRVRPGMAEGIMEDLAWLGLRPDAPVMWQSARAEAHGAALAALAERGLLFRCQCTRRDIEAAIGAPQEGDGASAAPYPGTCRGREVEPGRPHALRLDMGRALEAIGTARPVFREIGVGPEGQRGEIPLEPARLLNRHGDVVLRRKDGAVAYHLAVVLDDAAQDVTHVTRGKDLFEATEVHLLLQTLLGLTVPVYRHHRLVRDEHGRRLAKRHDALALATLRDRGATPEDVRAMVGLSRPGEAVR